MTLPLGRERFAERAAAERCCGGVLLAGRLGGGRLGLLVAVTAIAAVARATGALTRALSLLNPVVVESDQPIPTHGETA